ncbi:MAG: DMT family transporter [Ilumatobacteraceae bacterium]|nr:DMT family transporter [Ilumatobacteraceae bacterium]
MPVVVYGLLAALLIGSSDFLGARSAGRTTALQTTTAAFLGGAVAVAAFSPALGTLVARDLWLGAISGVAAAVALTALWQGYARSSIGVAAPVAAVFSTGLPVIYEALRGDAPGGLGWAGLVVGIVALVLTSWNRRRSDTGDEVRAGVVLGSVAGVAFAVMFVVAISTSEESGTWPVAAQRVTAFVLAVGFGLSTGRRPFADLASVRWSLLAGVFGACGVASTVYGGQRGPVAPVIVAGSMYPAVAVGLAWLFMRQRLTRRQGVGLVAALVGVALIAAD